MVNASKFVTAKYLSAKTAGEYNGKSLVIDSVFESDINEQTKLCLRLSGVDKVIVLNQTNLALLATAYGDNTDQWINHKVTLNLVHVSFNGSPTLSIQLSPGK